MYSWPITKFVAFIVEVAIEQQVIAEIVQQEDMAEEYETVEEDEFHMKELLPEHPHNWERYFNFFVILYRCDKIS